MHGGSVDDARKLPARPNLDHLRRQAKTLLSQWTDPGSGHALERLRRVSAARPAEVTGGTPPPPAQAGPVDREDPSAFDLEMTPLLRRLEGEWLPVHLVMDGKTMPAQWLTYGSRT